MNRTLLPETELWSIIMQLTAGLRAIHQANLACRYDKNVICKMFYSFQRVSSEISELLSLKINIHTIIHKQLIRT